MIEVVKMINMNFINGAWLSTGMCYGGTVYKNNHCKCKIVRVFLKPKQNV